MILQGQRFEGQETMAAGICARCHQCINAPFWNWPVEEWKKDQPCRITAACNAARVVVFSERMSEVTQILNAIEAGDPQGASRLLPVVYAELRQLAAAQLARERPGQTLDATALVHEAYLRLVPYEPDSGWQNRRHFYAAAAEAMRRILIESARRKRRVKHGGELRRVEFKDQPASSADDN